MLALRRSVNLVARAAHTYGNEDTRFLHLLGLLEDKLDTDLALCRHCHGQPRRSEDGLCHACDKYRRWRAARDGVAVTEAPLPSRDILRKRILRKDLQLSA